MRIPKSPPTLEAIFNSPSAAQVFLPEAAEIARRANADYLHWNKFRHYPMPNGFSHEVAWGAVSISRAATRVALPLTFREPEQNLWFTVPPCVHQLMHYLDRDAGGFIGSSSAEFDAEDRTKYLVGALIEEAIASSQIEGATTTREVAKKMLRSRRRPRDRSELMISNNYRAIQEIKDLKGNPLSVELIKHLQEVITDRTLEKPEQSGRFRTKDEDIYVADAVTGEELHRPPSAYEIDRRLAELCDFVNEPREKEFIHPLVVASAIHFHLGFVHPFADGNGRTARALFYWYMLKQGYWLFEYLPISRSINNSRVKYGRAYLYTETDGGDLTYFIHYILRAIHIAIQDAHRYIQRQQEIMRRAKQMFRSMTHLNPRQTQIAIEAVKESSSVWDLRAASAEYLVSRNTAKADLDGLVEARILSRSMQANRHVYAPSDHLRQHILKGTLSPSSSPEQESSPNEIDDGEDTIDIEGDSQRFLF